MNPSAKQKIMTHLSALTLLIVQENKDYPVTDSCINFYTSRFKEVRVVRKKGSSNILAKVKMEEWGNDAELTDAMNRVVDDVLSGHLLLLFSDEKLDETGFNAQPERWQAVTLKLESGKRALGRSIRLIPIRNVDRSVSKIFNGSVFPDCCSYLAEMEESVNAVEIVIRKKEPTLSKIRLEKLIENDRAKSSMDWYLTGVHFSEKQQYYKVEKALRLALTSSLELPGLYRISALNLLANAHAELNQYEFALAAICQSLEISNQQFAPYILKHKIMWIQKNWKEACQALECYIHVFEKESVAAYDFTLNIKEAHYLLAELYLRLKDREKAFNHFEKLYQISKGIVSPDVKEKLFIYAVELQNSEKARFYFEEFYFGSFKNKMSEKGRIRILGAISLFEEKGWNQMACEYYEVLFRKDPDSKEIMRRWIITMMRSDQLSRAQKAIQIQTR